MVALGTRKFVLNEIRKLGLRLISFESGAMIFENELNSEEMTDLERRLEKYGLELYYSEPSHADTGELIEVDSVRAY